MGQGISTSTAAPVGAAGIDFSEPLGITHETSLGASRFLKSTRGRYGDGQVVVKIFTKPQAAFHLKGYVDAIDREKKILRTVPNALAYHKVSETERNGYLVRQYLASSLYDRISTRPFLETVEKKWIAFQLLCGLRDCHFGGVFHGDIKTENVLVTNSNWVYLADFASFKPTYLPEDNPADFYYFFDTSGRRSCYLAPERFLIPGESRNGAVTEAMDIFSLGCVIAELFLEGSPLFTLSQLFKYRKGEFDPSQTGVGRIEEPEIRNLILRMVAMNPTDRLSAETHLLQSRRTVFPEYFYSFLHNYMEHVTSTSSRSRGSLNMIGECDDRIDRVYYEFDKISFFIGLYARANDPSVNSFPQTRQYSINFHLDIPNYQRSVVVRKRRNADDGAGALIFLTLVSSALRNTSRAASKIRACNILLALGEHVTDEAKLDRILPYIVALFNDESVIVRVTAIRTLAALMEIVDVVTPVNSHIFPEYVMPKLIIYLNSKNSIVRASYAACLASLADSSSRFLDMAQTIRSELVYPSLDIPGENMQSSEVAYQNLYDIARTDLVSQFQEHCTALLADGDASVRRAFLRSVSRLCIFFGKQKANDILLSHLNTYLNDKDWMLRCAFFETVVGVATFIGKSSLEEFVLPLMVQALTDPEEYVVERVLLTLATIAELGLFDRSKIWELLDIVRRFCVHPNIWIRHASICFIAQALKWLTLADVHCIAFPLIRPFLRADTIEFSELSLLANLQKFISRTVFEKSFEWSLKSEKGLFWRPIKEQRLLTFNTGDFIAPGMHKETTALNQYRFSKNEEDEMWIVKLRGLGMPPGDEWKIAALGEHIWRMACLKSRINMHKSTINSALVELQNLDVTPRTVFFTERQENTEQSPETARQDIPHRPVSILDATHELPHSFRTANSSSRNSTAWPVLANTGLAVSSKLVDGHKGETRLKLSIAELLHQKDDRFGKALPDTGANPIPAFGTMEAPSRGEEKQAVSEAIGHVDAALKYVHHDYDGSDPNILKLLDSMYQETLFGDLAEFAPRIVPLGRRRPIKRNNSKKAGPWRPEGNLVVQYGEHTGPINRVLTAPDHQFFLTASDDGTVKIWDTNRLEKNIANRARQTHKHLPGAKVKCLCVLEETHCFASGGTDGKVYVVKVEQPLHGAKYKLKILRTYQLPENEHAVWVEHFMTENDSVLLLATNKSRIIALSLGIMTILFQLQNPLHHGFITTFLLDKRRSWILIGTSHGILDLWDLRFKLRLKAWGLPGSFPIHRLVAHPTKGRGRWVAVGGGTGQVEFTVWDIERAQCRELYRAGTPNLSLRGYEPLCIDDQNPETILAKFANISAHSDLSGATSVDRGIRTLIADIDVSIATAEDNGSGSTQHSHYQSLGSNRGSNHGFFLTGGVDRKIRYWDLSRVESSTVVTGLGSEESKPAFSQSQLSATLICNSETPSPAAGFNPIRSAGSSSRPAVRTTSRSTVISLQQQQLLTSHLDCVTDIALLEVPYGMTISVDRAGCIFIFH